MQQTSQAPVPAKARERLLQAARDVFRAQGYAATSVQQLCEAAGVTKGAFFHHFDSKGALGVAVANYWEETTNALFDGAPYHDHADPLEQLLGYLDFRRELISGGLADFTCLVGTLAQENFESHPSIRDACGSSIWSHATRLEAMVRAAIELYRPTTDVNARSLALHIQVVLQGAFVVAKAGNEPQIVLDSIDHLERYLVALLKTRGSVQ